MRTVEQALEHAESLRREEKPDLLDLSESDLILLADEVKHLRSIVEQLADPTQNGEPMP
jgi:hypothetical protein